MNSVAEGYNRNPEHEWNRLIKSPYHTLEFLVYMHHITTHLQPKSLVLDAGGGPGRYTIELSRRGYEVVLFDISEGLVDMAKSHISSTPSPFCERILGCLAQHLASRQQIANKRIT